jgi:hypothetical protein
MDNHIPPVGTQVTRRWIKPSVTLDPATLEPVVARFRDVPRIAEAWLVGSRITPSDGAPPYESTGVALVLDPPFAGDAEADREAMVELIARLDDASPVADERRSWLFVTEAIMREHREQATLLYTRSR